MLAGINEWFVEGNEFFLLRISMKKYAFLLVIILKIYIRNDASGMKDLWFFCEPFSYKKVKQDVHKLRLFC